MRKLILVFFILSSWVIVSGQSTVAKIRYEQAEEAYNNGDYRSTLVKLEEVQKLLGGVNPRILYLRIMSENALVEKGNYSYGLLDSLRKDTQFYIKSYETNENLEDKFREVLALFDKLGKYPASQAEYDKIEADKLDAEKKKQVEAFALLQRKRDSALKTNQFIDSLAFVYKFKPGLTKEEFFRYNPACSSYLNSMGFRPLPKGSGWNEYYRSGPYLMLLGKYDNGERVDSFMVITGIYKSAKQKAEAETAWQTLLKQNVLMDLNEPGLGVIYSVRESEIIPVGLEIKTYSYNPNHNYNNDNYFITVMFRASRQNREAEKKKGL